jgi:hypothetical protein
VKNKFEKMKKHLTFIFIAIFLISGASAMTSDLGDLYKQKETVVAKIEGNILQPLQESQIELMKGASPAAFEYDLIRIDEVYYLWFVTPPVEGNYKLIIENVQVIEDGQAQVINYEKSFVVSNETEDYYVRPGELTASSDFFIGAVNNKDSSVSINVGLPTSRNVVLNPGENRINFFIRDFVGTQTIEMGIGKYKIPFRIYGIQNTSVVPNVTGQNSSSINQTNQSTQNPNNATNVSAINGSSATLFEFGSPVIKSTVSNLSVGKKISFQIINVGNKSINDLEFIYNNETFLVEPRSRVIPVNKSASFNLTILKIPLRYLRTAVVARSGGYTKNMVVILEVSNETKNFSVEYVNQSQSNPYYYCSELGGKICSANETCSEATINSMDGKCCVAECQQTSSGEGGSSWVGWVIAAVVLMGVGVIFFKYKKTGGNKESAVKATFLSAEKKRP